jgi:hypothetical protein
MRDRKLQRALMQFFKPENWFTVRDALVEVGRQDLIGSGCDCLGCDCLIPAQPPKEAFEARRHHANQARKSKKLTFPGWAPNGPLGCGFLVFPSCGPIISSSDSSNGDNHE